MLTAKENMREAIRGGKPDRVVNQFEAMNFQVHPGMMFDKEAVKGGPNVVNGWGITRSWPANVPGAFPVHTPETIVCKDIEHWQDYVHAPTTDFTDEQWGIAKSLYAPIDTTKSFSTTLYVSGLFEMTHHLCSIGDALMYYITNPDEMKDLIKYLTEWELKVAEQLCAQLKPEMMLHHDDWGSSTNSFLRPSMFEDFFLDAYKEIYGYYHDHGVEFIVHHSDSYGANLVDYMIEMGIDVWQGGVELNNIPALNEKYHGKICFMGDIDNKSVDFTEWSEENNRKVVRACLDRNTPNGVIPCIVQGGPGSVFPGVYLSLCNYIDEYNAEKFGHKVEDIAANRLPHDIMF